MRYERSMAITTRHAKLIKLIFLERFRRLTCQRNRKFRNSQSLVRDIDFLKQYRYSIRPVERADGWAYHLLAEPATDSNGNEASQT